MPPIMDDFNFQPVCRLLVVLAISCTLLTGCRQPGANPQGDRASLFNFGRPAGSGVFGNNARYADSRNANPNQTLALVASTRTQTLEIQAMVLLRHVAEVRPMEFLIFKSTMVSGSLPTMVPEKCKT